MKIAIPIIIVIVLVIAIFTIYYFNKEPSQTSNNLENNSVNLEKQETNQNLSQNTELNENQNLEEENMETIKIKLSINNKTFSATLNNNEAVKGLIEKLPLTLNMQDLNSNEKYNYLDFSLPTNPSRPNRINAGDIKLFGNDCLVIFYESFNTSYSYTDLGKIDDVEGFLDELGSGSVTIALEQD